MHLLLPKKNRYFLQNLIDLWDIRKKDITNNLGKLPSTRKTREKIRNFLKYYGFIDCDILLWTDITRENYITIKNISVNNISKEDQEDFHKKYMNNWKREDLLLSIAYENPNYTSHKYGIIPANIYRSQKFYLQSLRHYQIEDALTTNIVDKSTGIITMISSFRSDYEEKYFFNEDNRQKQQFIFSFLALNPHQPIAICNEHGVIEYEEYSFWKLCCKEFPKRQCTPKLPNTLLADLIKWNHKDSNKKKYKFVDFEVIQYKSIYCIQAIPKISEKNDVVKNKIFYLPQNNKAQKEIITVSKSPSIKPIDKIRQKEDKSVLYDNKNNNLLKFPPAMEGEKGQLPIIEIEKLLEEKQKISIESLQETLEKKDEIITKLKEKVAKLETELSKIKQRNQTLEQTTTEYQYSVAHITDNPELDDTPKPPEKALVLYPGGGKGKAITFLEDHYGQYLEYFGAKQDTLFQDSLGKLDKKLLKAVLNGIYTKRKTDKNYPKPPEIIPPKSKRIDRIIAFTPTETFKVISAIHSRKQRKTA